MPPKSPISLKTVDDLLKAMLVLSRTVDHVLETRAIHGALDEPLSSTKVQVLRLLGSRSGQNLVQISRYLGVSKPAVTQMIDGMTRSKLVRRRGDARDRRETIVELTKLGRQQLQALRREQRHVLRNAVRMSADADPEAWADMLKQVAGALARADQAFDSFCMQCGAHADGSCVLVGGDADCPFLGQGIRR